MPVPCASLLEEGGRLRSGRRENAARSGATLVELCVAMLLLTIVFAGWVRMNNIQAVNKESLRYAAVEKAAGMLDAVATQKREDIKKDRKFREGCYLQIMADGTIVQDGRRKGDVPIERILPLWGDDVAIGYQCHVETGLVGDDAASKWGNGSRWIVLDLFNTHGECRSKAESVASFRMILDRAAELVDESSK